MNIIAYDIIKKNIDKNKTWISVKYKRIFSKEIKYRKYYTLLSKYSLRDKKDNYYLACSDNIFNNSKTECTQLDNFNRCRFNIGAIWNKSNLKHIETDVNIDVKVVNQQNDGEIYRLYI